MPLSEESLSPAALLSVELPPAEPLSVVSPVLLSVSSSAEEPLPEEMLLPLTLLSAEPPSAELSAASEVSLLSALLSEVLLSPVLSVVFSDAELPDPLSVVDSWVVPESPEELPEELPQPVISAMDRAAAHTSVIAFAYFFLNIVLSLLYV